MSTGNARRQVFDDSQLFESVEITPFHKVADGVSSVRVLLPSCYFDRTKAEKGIEALENYRKKQDQRTGEFLESAIHDKFSHGADAFRYLAVNYDPLLGDVTQRANISRVHRGHSGWTPRVIRTGGRRW